MRLESAVLSGKRFRKPGGAWISTDPTAVELPAPDGARLSQIRINIAGQFHSAYFSVEDFRADDWETEPDPEPTPLEMVEAACKTIVEAFRKLQGVKAT